jgi:hypothetical protein
MYLKEHNDLDLLEERQNLPQNIVTVMFLSSAFYFSLVSFDKVMVKRHKRNNLYLLCKFCQEGKQKLENFFVVVFFLFFEISTFLYKEEEW